MRDLEHALRGRPLAEAAGIVNAALEARTVGLLSFAPGDLVETLEAAFESEPG